VFIGEIPEIAAYKSWFKDAEEPKEESKDETEAEALKKKAEADKKKADDHYQDEKYLYQENYGETMVAKKRPAIFVFDLEANKMTKVHFGKHLKETDYI